MNEVFQKEKKNFPGILLTSRDKKQTVYEIISAWEDRLNKYGAAGAVMDDFGFSSRLVGAMLNESVLDRAAIIGAWPGFGKSSMIGEYLRYMVRNDPKFGAIVVTEKLSEIESLVDYVNTEDPDAFLTTRKKYAFYIRGFDENEITREQYEAQFEAQVNYPVIVMTRKQFEVQTLKNNIHSFAYFDADKTRYPRRTLLIDEKPTMILNYQLSLQDVNSLLTKAQQAASKAPERIKRNYRTLRKHVNELRAVLEDAEMTNNNQRIDPVAYGYIIPREFLSHFVAVHDVDSLGRLRALGHVLSKGALMTSPHGNVSLHAAHRLHVDWTQFNTFIFDGSARIDPEYNKDDFYLVEPDNPPNYSNVTFHNCDRYTLSKTSLRNDAGSIGKIGNEVREIVKKHGEENGPVLVVTYKDFTDDFKKELSPEIEAGTVTIKHLDGGRGSNDWQAFNVAIYIGTLNKGSAYYPANASAAVGRDLDPSFKVSKNGLQYNEPLNNEYKSLDTAVHMIQETNRLRANKKREPVHFYVFNRDEDATRKLMEYYQGAKVTEHEPIGTLTGKKSAEDNVRDILKAMQPGEEMKQSDIYKKLEIGRTTFHKIMTKPETKELLESLGIDKVKTRLVKRG